MTVVKLKKSYLHIIFLFSESLNKMTGSKLFLTQFLALWRKKIYFYRLKYKVYLVFVSNLGWTLTFIADFFTDVFLLGLFQILLPIVLYIIISLISKSSESSESNDTCNTLTYSLANYTNTTNYLQSDDSSTAKMYKSLVKNSQKLLEIPTQENMTVYTLEHAVNHSVGASFKLAESSATGWFEADYIHSAPLTLNLIYQAIIKDKLGMDFGTVLTLDPCSTTSEYYMGMSGVSYFRAELLVFFSMIVFLLWINNLIDFSVKEQSTGVRALYFANGVKRWIYYMSAIVFDALVFFVGLLVFLIIITLLIRPDRFIRHFFSEILPTLLGFIMPAYFYALCHMYFFAMFFKKAFNAKIGFTAFYFLTGTFSYFRIHFETRLCLWHVKSTDHWWYAIRWYMIYAMLLASYGFKDILQIF